MSVIFALLNEMLALELALRVTLPWIWIQLTSTIYWWVASKLNASRNLFSNEKHPFMWVFICFVICTIYKYRRDLFFAKVFRSWLRLNGRYHRIIHPHKSRKCKIQSWVPSARILSHFIHSKCDLWTCVNVIGVHNLNYWVLVSKINSDDCIIVGHWSSLATRI